MIGMFGNIVFQVSENSVRNFKEFKRDTSARYATHDIISQKPRVEYLGQGLDTATLNIELSANLGVNVQASIDQWNSYCNNATVSVFVLGGRVIGRQWIITGVSQAYGIITNKGRILTATLDISLQEYN